MALYPTPAGHRMAYDRDGSALFYIDTTGTLRLAPLTYNSGVDTIDYTINKENNANTANLNDGNINVQTYVGVVFPELRDIAGYFLAIRGQNGGSFTSTVYTSTNTTNGQDGTWTSQGAASPYVGSPPQDAYRSSIQSITVSGVKGFRIGMFNTVSGGGIYLIEFHVYGMPSAGQNPDSLRIWQPVTNAEVTTVLDFGDIARGAAATQQFRVHNSSATKTASTITVSMEALTDSTPSQIGQYQLSTDNITFANSISIPNLGPGGTSAVLYVKDTVAAGAQTGVWAARIVVAAGTFA